jgi:hypothetical protein
MTKKQLKNFACLISMIFSIIYLIRLQNIKEDLKTRRDRNIQNSVENNAKPKLFLSGAPRSGLNVLKNLLNSNGLATCSESNSIISNFLFLVKKEKN